ncbi:MAG TPA: carboxypeptidase regulatory-like domain-containing protein [Saprospiraceae bacterium]|nr:carboxypeptidase regulatory-like domain-containing protein [Saprospiraceae bacterium]HPI06872.1 carboxypeptidase regulatory-like domain-containing protein [Saprospiraceae bacterium]
MKNLLFTLLLLCTAAALFSQNPPCEAALWPIDFENGVTTLTAIDSSGASVVSYTWSTGETTPEIGVTSEGEYCVTITFDNACSASACYTLSYQDCWSYASWWQNGNDYVVSAYGAPNYMEATYLWSNGSTASQFLTTEPGTYCVTVTRENGCTSTSCVTIPSLPACTTHIVEVGSASGVASLVAPDSIGSVSSYLWSTGETSPIIDAPANGEYCVTVTYNFGCSATDCYTVDNTNCNTYTLVQPLSNSFQVTAYTLPFATGATYLWSNGVTTSSFNTTELGEYCVTVTQYNGCTSTSCVSVTPNQINVYVHNADSITTPIIAQVYLIQFDTIAGTLTAVYSQQTDINGSGYTLFENVPPGKYLLKAAIVPGTAGFNENLPTYYPSELLWSDAQPIYITMGGWTTAVIQLILGNNPGGPGFIGGLVSEGANLTGHPAEAEFSGEGDPIAGASIILTLPDGTAVAAATTDATGAYSFPSLAYGTYVVTINIPGVTPVSTTITISPAQPGFSGINFDVTQNGAVLAAKEVDYEVFASVSPNPTNDVVQVSLKEPEGMLLLSNMQGQILLRQTVTGNQMRLSLASLPAGVYALTAGTSKGAQSTRIIKN